MIYSLNFFYHNVGLLGLLLNCIKDLLVLVDDLPDLAGCQLLNFILLGKKCDFFFILPDVIVCGNCGSDCVVKMSKVKEFG